MSILTGYRIRYKNKETGYIEIKQKFEFEKSTKPRYFSLFGYKLFSCNIFTQYNYDNDKDIRKQAKDIATRLAIDIGTYVEIESCYYNNFIGKMTYKIIWLNLHWIVYQVELNSNIK